MRLPDWPERLNGFLMSTASRPFAWGVWDCCIFANEAVRVIRGAPVLEDWSRDYDGPVGALRVLRDLGATSIIEAVDARLPQRGIGFARRGDLVAVPSVEQDWPALGVVSGAGLHVLSPEGMRVVRRENAIAAWEVD